MSRKKAVITVQETKLETREMCPCPLCTKRAMDILNDDTIELKCPHCDQFVPIPWDKAKRALMVAESKPTMIVYGRDEKP